MTESQAADADTTRSESGRAETHARRSLIEQPILRRRSEPDGLCLIGPSAREVLCTIERVLTGSGSEALLIWPQRPDGIAIYHALAALNRLETCDRTGLVTLFFPWSRSTGATQRTLLLDREVLDKATLPPLNRVMSNPPSSRAFSYLMALHSLKHLLKSGKEDKRFRQAVARDPGLLHPTLYEIMPQHGVQNRGLRSYQDEFLRRTRRHTWISERQKYIEDAADPTRTPFFLAGVHADAIRVERLRSAGIDPRHDGRLPDIVLADLTRRARNRLGRNWRQALKRFLAILHDMYGTGSPPLLAITDDTFALQALRWDIIKDYEARRDAEIPQKKPAVARVVLNPKPDLLDQETIGPAPTPKITVETHGSDVLALVEFGLRLRRSLLDAGETDVADAVSAAVDALQNTTGLPGPPAQFYDFLSDNYDGYELHSIGGRFDVLPPGGRIKTAITLGLGGANQRQLSEFLESYEMLCAGAAAENPGHKLLDRYLQELSRKASRSIIVFSSEALRGFAEWRIENDDTLSHVRSSLHRKLMLVDRREAVEELDLDQREQKLFHRIVFVEPHADDFLHLLTRPWLPGQVFVVANLACLERALRRVRILLDLDGIEPVRERLLTVQTEFERSLEGHATDIPDLDAEPPPPRLGTLDLTAASPSGQGLTRIVATSGDLEIKAFDGSEVAYYDPEAVQPFSRRLAKDLQPGDQICVFSPDFVGMAREKLNLTANASEILPLYHRTVAEAARKLPGADITAKAGALRRKMEALNSEIALPSIQAMRHWIDVAALIDAPRNEVRPQAPRDRRHYLSFMKALGVGDELARHYWDWGIFWTRSMRIRSGSAFHQVFMGILIDPYGTASRLPESRRHDVWRIYETAEHHVVTVISNEREGGDEEG